MKEPEEFKEHSLSFSNSTGQAKDYERNIRMITEPGKVVPFYLVHVFMPGLVTIEYRHVIKVAVQSSYRVNNREAVLKYSSVIRVGP